MPFHAATLVPQNRHCRAMIADWLKLSNKKKVQPADTSMDPPVEEMDRIPLLALLMQEKQHIPAIPSKSLQEHPVCRRKNNHLTGIWVKIHLQSACVIVKYEASRPLKSFGTGLLRVPRAITKHSNVVFSLRTYCLWNKLSAQNVILFESGLSSTPASVINLLYLFICMILIFLMSFCMISVFFRLPYKTL